MAAVAEKGRLKAPLLCQSACHTYDAGKILGEGGSGRVDGGIDEHERFRNRPNDSDGQD
jgi:hypothetical protein